MAVVSVFADINMNLGIPGLVRVLDENDYDVDSLRTGDMFMFLNRKRTSLKVLVNEFMLVQFRKPTEITLEEIERLPAFIKGITLSQSARSQLLDLQIPSTTVRRTKSTSWMESQAAI